VGTIETRDHGESDREQGAGGKAAGA